MVDEVRRRRGEREREKKRRVAGEMKEAENRIPFL